MNKAERNNIQQIAKRTSEITGADMVSLVILISSCHNSACRLDLEGLRHAEKDDLLHDVFGINDFYDREKGELKNCFLPRYAK